MKKEYSNKERMKMVNSYIKEPNLCPFCKSSNIDAGPFDANDLKAYRNVICRTCEEEWTEEFKITGITI